MNIIIIFVVAVILWSLWGYFSSRVEHADYTIIRKASDYEVREYPAHIVAQTTVQGKYEEALREGFRIVAGYIFGGNVKKASIAMTAPVTAQQPVSEKIAMTAPVLAETDGNSRVISFGMPRSYTFEALPTPTDSRVKIIKVPAKKFAAVRFSWWRSDARVRSMEAKLILSLSRDGIAFEGSPIYAGYNAPWTPPWLIRNEVMVEIK